MVTAKRSSNRRQKRVAKVVVVPMAVLAEQLAKDLAAKVAVDAKQELQEGWLGVVGSRVGLNRLQLEEDSWWCLPSIAKPGALVIMYCTRTASVKMQGIFAIFRFQAFDPVRNSDCGQYGLTGGFGTLAYARMNLVKRLPNPISMKALKTDPLLQGAHFLRRNFQGTFFKLRAMEQKRLLVLAGI